MNIIIVLWMGYILYVILYKLYKYEGIKRIENKLDTLIKLISEDVKTNCGKMGEHIDFVETVYENVKIL